MAITWKTVRDRRTFWGVAVRLMALGVAIGIALGAFLEWRKLDDFDAHFFTQYTTGRAMASVGFTDHAPMVQFQRFFRNRWPERAVRIEDVLHRSFYWPWPFVGLAIGLALLAIANRDPGSS